MPLGEGAIPVLTVLIGGVVAIITAIRIAAVAIIRALRVRDDVLREVGTTVATIAGHVNSERTAAEERSKAKDREIELLREMLQQEKQSAALLAQAAAARTRESALPTTP